MRKTWFDLNGGYLFDPVIRAFSNSSSSPLATASSSATTSIQETGLPENYVDMRYRGLGLVFDFGWRRTEKGMAWEISDWERTTNGSSQGVKNGWMRVVLGKLRICFNGMMGMMWPREGSLVGIW